jgi:lipopolysaccharide export system protein LptC
VKSRANTIFSLALAAGLAGLTFWLERTVNAPGGAPRGEVRHEPDFIVDQVSATTLDVTGRPESKLTAQKMRHFADDQSTELEAPRLVQLRPDSPSVHIEADRGVAAKSGDDVRLYGNVVVRREATPGRPELRVETSYLQVFPKEDIARTSEEVVIREGGSRLTGVGMEYNNKTRQLELKSRVTGTFRRTEG